MKIYPVFIPHAGCPHRCLFCAQDRSTGQAAAPSPQAVSVWLDQVLPGAGDGEIAFYGGTFTLLPLLMQERYLAVARRYVARGQAAGVRISTRPDALDVVCVERLRRHGVTTVEIGAQSFDDQVLDASGRGHVSADTVSAFRRCQAAGLRVGLQLMPGLPAADAAEAMQSLRIALELKPDFLRIYPTVVIRGTGLAELWSSGRYRSWALEAAVELCADMLHLCQTRQMPVIRIGLQQDPELEQNLLAGPYHAAFGQLVRSRLWRRALSSVHAFGNMAVNPDDLSDVIGHRGENRQWAAQKYPLLSVSSSPEIERGWMRISDRVVSLLEASASERTL